MIPLKTAGSPAGALSRPEKAKKTGKIRHRLKNTYFLRIYNVRTALDILFLTRQVALGRLGAN
jgi:hypothetical protein